MKHLTFKTVFLLVLGSGKRRSEIHAWQNRKIRHQSDWSRCPCTLHPAFQESAGQRGSRQCGPRDITALAPKLDRSLKSDRSLCPVRALRYYLNRTSSRIRRWFLSPLRKVLTKTPHLPLSPLGSSRL